VLFPVARGSARRERNPAIIITAPIKPITLSRLPASRRPRPAAAEIPRAGSPPPSPSFYSRMKFVNATKCHFVSVRSICAGCRRK
jgi:hypothetical protein